MEGGVKPFEKKKRNQTVLKTDGIIENAYANQNKNSILSAKIPTDFRRSTDIVGRIVKIDW